MSVEWPTELGDRTPPAERSSTSNFSASLGQTTSQLEDEMDRLGVDRWRGEIANQHTKSNGLPLHNANPDDPGFVLRWTDEGTDHAVGCDHYAKLRDNVREVFLWMRETRLSGDRPVRTGRSQFASAALPSADEDAVVAEEPPHEVLEVAPDAGPDVIEAAARRKAANVHPDKPDGDEEEFIRIQKAKEQLLEDGGVA